MNPVGRHLWKGHGWEACTVMWFNMFENNFLEGLLRSWCLKSLAGNLVGRIVIIQAFLLMVQRPQENLWPSYQPGGKSPQSVLSLWSSIANQIYNYWLFKSSSFHHLSPKKRKRRRLKMIGKKRCTHTLTDNITSKPWNIWLSKLSQFHLRMFFYLFSAQLAPLLRASTVLLTPCDVGKQFIPMQRDFSPMSFSAKPHDLLSAWNHTKYCKTFVREELILVSCSCRTLSGIQESRQNSANTKH